MLITDENQKERKARADKQADDNNADAIRAMKISKIKQDTLLSLCDEMAFDINKILASYHHKSISEITEGEYQYIVANKDKANVRKDLELIRWRLKPESMIYPLILKAVSRLFPLYVKKTYEGNTTD